MIIMQHPIECPEIDKIRDVFVFCCLTGLSYIDVKYLREDNIQRSFDGQLWIMIKRSKTGVPSNVRLLSIPQQILDNVIGIAAPVTAIVVFPDFLCQLIDGVAFVV